MSRFDLSTGNVFRKSCYLFLAMLIITITVRTFIIGEIDGDTTYFFNESQRIRNGEVPFVDFKPVYGPLAAIFTLGPGLLTDNIQIYSVIFNIVSATFIVLTGYLIKLICDMYELKSYPLIAYVLMIGIYFVIGINRIDIIAAFFMLLAIYLFLKSRSAWSYPIAIVGGLIKLFPIIIIPFLVFASLWEKESRKKMFIGFGSCVCLGLIAFMVAAVVGLNILYVLDLGQMDRQFQCESMVATVAVIISYLGGPTVYFSDVVSPEITGPICDFLCEWWMFVVFALCAMLALMFLYVMNRDKNKLDRDSFFRKVIAGCTAVTLLFLVSNKVFSTQFIQLFIPLLAICVCCREKKDMYFVAGVSVAIILISFLCQNLFYLTGDPRDYCYPLLLVRDLLMIYIIAMLCRYMITDKWKFIPDFLDK